MDRIANITGIPEANSENLQMLRYTESQLYATHNDFIPHQIDRQSGVRIATFYIYLNDVEEGGAQLRPSRGEDRPALPLTPPLLLLRPAFPLPGFPGETNFPRNHNLSVRPKKGRAVVWPSVLDSNPNMKDGRSDHQAMPVIRGVKYGANAWVRPRDAACGTGADLETAVKGRVDRIRGEYFIAALTNILYASRVFFASLFSRQIHQRDFKGPNSRGC
jgi:prolyl 4-hydroxylase